jgi:hypothetical protein
MPNMLSRHRFAAEPVLGAVLAAGATAIAQISLATGPQFGLRLSCPG